MNWINKIYLCLTYILNEFWLLKRNDMFHRSTLDVDIICFALSCFSIFWLLIYLLIISITHCQYSKKRVSVYISGIMRSRWNNDDEESGDDDGRPKKMNVIDDAWSQYCENQRQQQSNHQAVTIDVEVNVVCRHIHRCLSFIESFSARLTSRSHTHFDIE